MTKILLSAATHGLPALLWGIGVYEDCYVLTRCGCRWVCYWCSARPPENAAHRGLRPTRRAHHGRLARCAGVGAKKVLVARAKHV